MFRTMSPFSHTVRDNSVWLGQQVEVNDRLSQSSTFVATCWLTSILWTLVAKISVPAFHPHWAPTTPFIFYEFQTAWPRSNQHAIRKKRLVGVELNFHVLRCCGHKTAANSLFRFCAVPTLWKILNQRDVQWIFVFFTCAEATFSRIHRKRWQFLSNTVLRP